MFRHVNSLVNSLLGDIAPENHSRSEDVIESRSRLGVVHNRSHFTMVKRDFSNIMATGKEKRSMSFCGFTFRVVTWIPQISGYAFTLIGKKKGPIEYSRPTTFVPSTNLE
jgi:hypothetical protein